MPAYEIIVMRIECAGCFVLRICMSVKQHALLFIMESSSCSSGSSLEVENCFEEAL